MFAGRIHTAAYHVFLAEFYKENINVKRAFPTRPFPECAAQGAYSGFNLSGQWHQAAGTDRII
jgi:hypothetical protein